MWFLFLDAVAIAPHRPGQLDALACYPADTGLPGKGSYYTKDFEAVTTVAWCSAIHF